ncbi:MAG: hypothetical protein HC921_19745 [Synechococcaceae cyanobacterium SM2_3_1]|nr:hypothetical protein [Synechococcaceae cyanobacterium SM2_3_1]
MSETPHPDRLEQLLAFVIWTQNETDTSYQTCAARLAEKSRLLDTTCERIKAHVETLQTLIQQAKHNRARLISQRDRQEASLDEVSRWLKKTLRDPRHRLDQF